MFGPGIIDDEKYDTVFNGSTARATQSWRILASIPYVSDIASKFVRS
jgi:hypothetical protein